MTIKQLLIAGLCCVTPSLIAQTGKIKLSEMDLSSIYQPYGTPASGKAVTGEPLQVAGTLFADGVGVQANSKIKIYNLYKIICKFSVFGTDVLR